MSTTYRSDIDGLRAIAILSVVIFHAFPKSFPGGLVGVDIFFVISGFLITGLITGQLALQSFSFGNFYARRIKRILPILLVVLGCTFLFGWFVLYPYEYQILGKHIAAAATFTSNFVYLGESGYFDAGTDAKPLLHLWSLAIEEQFYLFWPLMLVVCIRIFGLNNRRLRLLMLFITIGSFGYGIYKTHTRPDAAYYLPFTRFWELSLGGFLALVPKTWHKDKAISPGPTIGGLVLIALSFVLIDEHSGFPGYIAMLPCLGTAGILLADSDSTINKHILGSKLLVFFGLTSYSFYLWHWPVLFFTRNLIAEPGTLVLCAALLLAFILAVTGYYLLETPLRHARSKYVPLVVFLLFAVMGYIGFNTFQRNGLDFREVNGRVFLTKLIQARFHTGPTDDHPASTLSFAVSAAEEIKLRKLSDQLRRDPESLKRIRDDSEKINNDVLFCSTVNGNNTACSGKVETKSPSGGLVVEVVGDSHAGNFYQALTLAYPAISFVPFIEGGCVPISKRYHGTDTVCGKVIASAMAYAESNKVDLVMFAARWPGSFEEIQPDLEHYRKYVRRISIVGPSLTFYKDVYKIIADYTFTAAFNDHILDNFDSSSIALNDAMGQFAAAHGTSYIDKISLFCRNNICPLAKDDYLLIFDKGHLTGTGVSYLASRLRTEDPIAQIISESTSVPTAVTGGRSAKPAR